MVNQIMLIDPNFEICSDQPDRWEKFKFCEQKPSFIFSGREKGDLYVILDCLLKPSLRRYKVRKWLLSFSF